MIAIAFRSIKNRDHIARKMRAAGCKPRRSAQRRGERRFWIEVRNTIAFHRYMASRGVFR